MKEIIIKSYGKINLSLDVVRKREDGYHDIDTIMQRISLYDNLHIKRILGDDLIIKSNNKLVPLDNTNLVYKGWEKLKKYKKEETGIEIFIDKKIPMAAGLAGGSTNVASFMAVLNKIWNLNLKNEELMQIGKTIGADVAYFFDGRTCRAQGIGEILTPIKEFKGHNVLIVNNGKDISSKYVYTNIKPSGQNDKMTKVIEAIEENNLEKLQKYGYNNMEEVSFNLYKDIEIIKKDMLEKGADFSLMSGSGPTVFGIFEDLDKLYKTEKYFKEKYKNVYIAKTI